MTEGRAMKVLGPSVSLAAFFVIPWLMGRREPQEFVAAGCGFLVGLLTAVYYWFPTRGTR